MQDERDPAAIHLMAIRDLCYAGADGLPKAFRDGLVAVINGHVQELSAIIRKGREAERRALVAGADADDCE